MEVEAENSALATANGIMEPSLEGRASHKEIVVEEEEEKVMHNKANQLEIPEHISTSSMKSDSLDSESAAAIAKERSQRELPIPQYDIEQLESDAYSHAS